jgi:hypothetical protein
MADAANTKTNLDALYKIVYPTGIENAIPDQTILQTQVPFKVMIGEEHKAPVILSLPGGATWGGENTGDASGAYELSETVASDSKKLAVKGSQITIREVVGYGAAKSARGGPESFKDCVGHVFEGMALYGRRLIEQDLLDGQASSCLGVVESVTTGTNAGTATITAASWAPGRFIGTKGHKFTAAAVSTGEPGNTIRAGCATITSVNYSTRTITFSHTATTHAIAATDLIYWANPIASASTTYQGQWMGASGWKSALGMVKATKTTGTVWGQDNTSFELIRGETKDAGSTDLSFDTLSDAMGQLFIKGATGSFNCVVSPETWTNLISPEVAARRHDASYKPEKVTVGHEAIEFRHLTGSLKIYAHPMDKGGEALIYNPSFWYRVGSTDLTFEQDVGANVKKIFLHVSNKNGFELRAYSDQAPFTRRLGYNCYIYNIVNS